jgi:CDP-glucose 4,6-dehydratase
MFTNVFRNKTVLVTGHTGFKGSWLCIWLRELGARVVGYGLEPLTEKDNFVVTHLDDRMTHIIGDIREFHGLRKVFIEFEPEFVFHLAAQPIVKLSYDDPKETYDTNIGGTVNLFECCRKSDTVRVVVNVTSDKCYENKEWVWGYRENDPMGGYDPYSSSKGCAELITQTYRNAFFNPRNYDTHKKSLSSVRAGNVIGGGDWQQYRIIPDCLRALEKNEPIQIRNPGAIRPWQHVLEPLSGYLLLASKMYRNPTKYSGAWNFGPGQELPMTVGDVVNQLLVHWGSGSWFNASENGDPHEAELLCLDIRKSESILKWFPTWDTQKAISQTIAWYRNYRIKDPYNICVDQINEFQNLKRGQ